MDRKQKKASKKIWILSVFVVFIAIAMSFVSWLIYAVFSQSYREIKQQYYGVVSRQVVEDIENSIRNGKQIERFYGMDKVLNDMLKRGHLLILGHLLVLLRLLILLIRLRNGLRFYLRLSSGVAVSVKTGILAGCKEQLINKVENNIADDSNAKESGDAGNTQQREH